MMKEVGGGDAHQDLMHVIQRVKKWKAYHIASMHWTIIFCITVCSWHKHVKFLYRTKNLNALFFVSVHTILSFSEMFYQYGAVVSCSNPRIKYDNASCISQVMDVICLWLCVWYFRVKAICLFFLFTIFCEVLSDSAFISILMQPLFVYLY